MGWNTLQPAPLPHLFLCFLDRIYLWGFIMRQVDKDGQCKGEFLGPGRKHVPGAGTRASARTTPACKASQARWPVSSWPPHFDPLTRGDIYVWNTCLIFCLNIIWNAVLQKGSNNLTFFRCTWLLLALSSHVYNLENQHMVVCPFIHLATVSLALVPLPKVKYKQRRAAAKYHLLSSSQAVNDSHLIAYFFLHTHLAYASSHQHLSLQLSLQWFSLTGASVTLLLPNLVIDYILLSLPGQHTFLYCI